MSAWRGLVLLPMLLALACAGGTRPSSPDDSAAPAAAAQRADDALRSAYAHADAAPLAGVVGGRALTVARRQLAELARRGTHRDEVVDERRVVHESVAGDHAEVVLLVRGRQRQVTGSQPAPAYANFLRQWRATLNRRSGRWLVVDAGDLPPPQWWPS